MQARPMVTSTTGCALFHQTYNPSKHLAIMIYIFIVALEFLLAFIGVALLVRFYNHKA